MELSEKGKVIGDWTGERLAPERLAPPVSVKDRSLPGPVIEFELY